MKKILSTLLVAAMLLSLVIVATVPAAAADGMWAAYSYLDNYSLPEEEQVSIPGYEYTDDGVRMIPADWTGQTPYGTLQTKEPWNLQDGFYLEVRIDEYDYDAGDRWFSLSIKSQAIPQAGGGDTSKYGYGVTTLNRPKKVNLEDDSVDNDVPAFVVDGFSGGVYYTRGFTETGFSTDEKAANAGLSTTITPDEDGFITVVYELKYDGENYTLYTCGVPAPAAVNAYIAEAFPDGMAYVGFTLQSNMKDGKVGCTITKFGTSEATATVPVGDDEQAPVNNVDVVAEIADASTVPEGQPAIVLTGDLVNSDTGKAPASSVGGKVSINDDFTVHGLTEAGNLVDVSFRVKNEVSYAVEDFPVVLLLTKNFCTCEDPTDCYAMETVSLRVMNGEIIAADDRHKMGVMEICWNPILVEDGDKAGEYLYFFYDVSGSSIEETGRINGARFDFEGIKQEAGRNGFDIELVAYFRTVEEAEAYVYEYLAVEEETTEPTETTEPKEPTEPTEPTEATEATEATEPKEATEPTEATDPGTSSGGCGSVVGTGIVAIVAVAAACGIVSFKKKED